MCLHLWKWNDHLKRDGILEWVLFFISVCLHRGLCWEFVCWLALCQISGNWSVSDVIHVRYSFYVRHTQLISQCHSGVNNHYIFSYPIGTSIHSISLIESVANQLFHIFYSLFLLSSFVVPHSNFMSLSEWNEINIIA